MSNYNNIFEKINSSSDISQITNNITQLYLKDTNLKDHLQCFLNEIVKLKKCVQKNEHKAFDYYQKSAEMNDSYGVYFVGVCHEEEIGVEKNEHKAFIYYQKFAEMGDASGTF
ncbi:hypothetical protein C2G38_2182735 [Gigaspora rosea]|uniref:HCP-like protein n=1 Tax=Gigaspora rosea TaxID=44941 RepID=A0A397V9L1_9GLOM|nr:hypothetical protein C2G38_2182735 [Gigaspora rosea]